MYNKDFFQEQFVLIDPQATDYLKAYNRLNRLLKEIDPLRAARRHRFYHYENEALQMLDKLHLVENETDAMALLAKLFYGFAKSGKQQAFDAARAILSVRDNYIWPQEIYDEWKETGVPGKPKSSPAAVIYAARN